MNKKRPTVEEVLTFSSLIGLPQFNLKGCCDVWYDLFHEVGHWAVLPDWLISLNLNSEFAYKYGNESLLQFPPELLSQEWETLNKPISEIPTYKLTTQLQYQIFPIRRIPSPWVWLKNPDGSKRILRMAPNENGVRAWCFKALEVLGWANPSDDICAQPGLWRDVDNDFWQIEKYFGTQFTFRPPNNYCFLDWGASEAEDKVFACWSHWGPDF